MIFEDDIPSHIILHEADFPSYYTNKMHPDDFKITENPMQYETIFHKKFHHNRLILRISIFVENRFIPISFICDTGAPDSFYLSSDVIRLLSDRLKEDDLGATFIKINNKRFFVGSTPSNHDSINIIGLKALSFFGLCLEEDGFYFTNLPEFF